MEKGEKSVRHALIANHQWGLNFIEIYQGIWYELMTIVTYLNYSVKWPADVIQYNYTLRNYYNMTNKKRCLEIMLLSR